MPPYLQWYSVPEYAAAWNKDPSTIRKWVYSGFILSLGYRVVRDPSGHWQIGVPSSDVVNSVPSHLT